MHSSHSASNKRSTHCPKKYAQLKQCDETIIKHISFCYYQFIIYNEKTGHKSNHNRLVYLNYKKALSYESLSLRETLHTTN